MKYVLAMAFVLLLSNQVLSWDSHYQILTLLNQNMSDESREVKAKSLADFLNSIEPTQLNQAILSFYREKNEYFPFPDQWKLLDTDYQKLIGGQRLSAEEFCHAIGLSPKAFSEIKAPEYNPQSSYSLKQWLQMFSDEPDWGGDDFLFNRKDKRYGKIPFGEPKRTSSRGAFHMYFGNESELTYTFKPSLRESMTHMRFLLFNRLAETAQAAGEEYWATRFKGNALHYLQDVTVPYHAKAAPNFTSKSYAQFLLAGNKKKFIADSTQVLTNRHFIYEMAMKEFTETILAENLPANVISGKDCMAGILHQTLSTLVRRSHSESPINWPNFVNTSQTIAKQREVLASHPVEFFKNYSRRSSAHATDVDQVIAKSFPSRLVNDPKVLIDKIPDFKANLSRDEILAFLRGTPTGNKELYQALTQDLNNVLEATAAFTH